MSHTVYISAIIHAPLEQVWPMFRDFNGLAGWHPAWPSAALRTAAARTHWVRCGT